MSKNMHVVSATFDGQLMAEPMSYRTAHDGQTVEDTAGIDDTIASSDLVKQRGEIQVSFKDWDNAKTMLTTKWGGEGTLTLITQVLSSATTKTLTLTLCRCKQVIMDAVHNDPGTHIAIFVQRSSDGASLGIT